MEKTKKEKISLLSYERDIIGKKVKKLRAEGKLPCNIFGQGFKSRSIWINVQEFRKIYKIAGATQVVYVHLDKEEYPTLIDTIQKHPISHELLHVDFKKVNLKEKIEAEVPIEFVKTSEAVEKKKGDMLTLKDSLLVKALPDKIPTNIEVDLSSLVDIDDEITIGQLPKSSDYEFIEESETVVVRISEHKEESVEPETTVEMPEVEGEVQTEESEQTDKTNENSDTNTESPQE